MNSTTVDIAAARPRNRRLSIPVGRGPSLGGFLFRIVFALLLTAGLLVFLALTRLEFNSAPPTLSIRSIDRADPVSLPAPPPPSAEKIPPPPPPATELPKLNLEIDPVAPPIAAAVELPDEVQPTLSDFAPAVDAPREAMTFSLSDVDNKPRLLNRPTFSFPEELKREGVEEGVVELEIHLSATGRISVKRLISSSHPELIPVAKKFASRARFTPVEIDGRAVNLTFVWPITFDY